MKVVEVIEIRHDPTARRIVLQIIEDTIHLVEFAFGIDVLDAKLVAIGFADAAVLVCPSIPDVGMEVMDVIGLLLVNPKTP